MKAKALAAIAALILIMAFAGAVAAQDSDVITAQVDRNVLTTDDLLTLTVTVDQATAVMTEPQPPAFTGFNVLSTNSSTQISLVNGDMTVQMVYTYYLQPAQPGELAIEPFSIDLGGQVYQTSPITVQVTQGTGQSQPSIPVAPGMRGIPAVPGMPNLQNLLQGMIPGTQPQPSNPPSGTIPAPTSLNGQDFYAEATVDKTNPYQGEQVIYTFRFYQGASLAGEPDYQEPGFTGFWHEQQSEQNTYTTEAAGRTYYVTELQTVLFPTVTGDVTIDPARLDIPGGFFDAGQTLVTQPINLTVRPLPPNPPADFQGAVGQYTLQSIVDTATSQVNGAVTLQVTQSGAGNLNTLGDLTWQVGPEWRPFDPKVNSSTTFENGVLKTTRIYEQVLVPTQPGDLTIPAISFSYFDPAAGSYQTAATQPITVQVAADPNAVPATVGDGASTQAVSALGDLRPLKAAPTSWRTTALSLVERPAYWLLWVAPLALFGGATALTAARRRRDAGAPMRRQQAASKHALDEIAAARTGAEPAHEAGARILNDYLSTKLGRPTAGMTDAALDQFLREQGISPETAAQVAACRRTLDISRYMPGNEKTVDQAVLDSVEATVRAVDGALAERAQA